VQEEKQLVKGNEALAEAAIRAGCRYFFGYPITPQNQIPEYMAAHLPAVGGVYLQAESEVAAINMVYGAAGAGARVMTSSSGPGISLKQEGISYIAGAELPCVIVNIMRSGPGLGGILPSQADYFQATKGGGHGDYHLLVLAPASVQEMVDLTVTAFDLADIYRNPVMILADGILGQMMEPVSFDGITTRSLPPKDWATTGAAGRPPNLINSLYIVGEEMERVIERLQAKYAEAAEKETRWEEYRLDDAELVLVAYGTTARVCKSVVNMARDDGLRVGLLRPVTLFPFPCSVLAQVADNVHGFLVCEMSSGQMVEDVRLAVNGKRPVEFYGRKGGIVPAPREILGQVYRLMKSD